jgi:hypothetical protein
METARARRKMQRRLTTDGTEDGMEEDDEGWTTDYTDGKDGKGPRIGFYYPWLEFQGGGGAPGRVTRRRGRGPGGC